MALTIQNRFEGEPVPIIDMSTKLLSGLCRLGLVLKKFNSLFQLKVLDLHLRLLNGRAWRRGRLRVLVLLFLLIDQLFHLKRLRRIRTFNFDRGFYAHRRTSFTEKRRTGWRCPFRNCEKQSVAAAKGKQLLIDTGPEG